MNLLLICLMASMAQGDSGPKSSCPTICERDWSEGCSCEDPLPVPNYWAGLRQTDVTFFAFGDSQFPSGPADMNDKNAEAMNAADSLLWWTAGAFGVDQPVSHVRGVIMAGDITADGLDGRYNSADNIGEFIRVYGLCGNAILKYPVFEGWGNHDYTSHILYRITLEHPCADAVSRRNPFRAGLVNMAPGNEGHYSWEWDNIHFVCVNLAPTDVVPDTETVGDRDPRNALTFLQEDLLEHVAGKSKRVVVFSHYGFYASWDFDGWWTPEEADDYYNIISAYDIIAHIHGHAHNTQHYTWRGIHVFNVGTAYYDDLGWNPDGRGRFAVFRITNDTLYAGDAGWNPDNPSGDILFPKRWSAVIPLTPLVLRDAITSSLPPDAIRNSMPLTLIAPEGSAYLWKKDGQPLLDQPGRLSGVTSRYLVFTPVSYADAGVYTVDYDNGVDGIVTSYDFQLVVLPGPLPAMGSIGLFLAGIAIACGRGRKAAGCSSR